MNKEAFEIFYQQFRRDPVCLGADHWCETKLKYYNLLRKQTVEWFFMSASVKVQPEYELNRNNYLFSKIYEYGGQDEREYVDVPF